MANCQDIFRPRAVGVSQHRLFCFECGRGPAGKGFPFRGGSSRALGLDLGGHRLRKSPRAQIPAVPNAHEDAQASVQVSFPKPCGSLGGPAKSPIFLYRLLTSTAPRKAFASI
jgi:hypothetical protein